MSETTSTSDKGGFDQTALSVLRLGGILLAVYCCFKILAPFIPLVLWGAIIAVAIYPLHLKLAARIGNRVKLSATLMTLLGLMILTGPVVVLTRSSSRCCWDEKPIPRCWSYCWVRLAA